MIELASGISGYLMVSELEEGSSINHMTERFKQGDTIEAMLKGFD